MPGRPELIAISVYGNDDINDDVSFNGCDYIGDTKNSRVDNDAVFKDYEWMIEGTREPIKQLYNVTDEYIDSLNYHYYQKMTDTAATIDFEGIPAHETYFTDDQWELDHKFQKVYFETR